MTSSHSPKDHDHFDVDQHIFDNNKHQSDYSSTFNDQYLPEKRQLYRVREGRVLAGVLGGIAEYYNINVTMLRLIFIASCLLPGPQWILYIAGVFLMPNE